MKRPHLLAAAFLADQLAGDPEWFPHPVRLMGLAITRGERALRSTGNSNARSLVKGAGLTAGLVLTSYAATRTAIRLAHNRSRILGALTEIALAWTCLAARNLQQEAAAVMAALESGDLPAARTRLARIVGRDTATLDTAEISRALMETLAESASDGVLAPTLYLALGGAPLAMAYKAVNTLDSMIGHRDYRYLYFGKVAARLDDLANYVPARVTAACLVCLSCFSPHTSPSAAWLTWQQDGSKHKSPNAGQPEAAMAGALGVRLGGDNSYAGELIPALPLGNRFPAPTIVKARHAMRLTHAAAWLGLAVGVLIAATLQARQEPCR